MTAKERVQAALRHEQPDICPWHLDFTQVAHQKMAEYTGGADFVGQGSAARMTSNLPDGGRGGA